MARLLPLLLAAAGLALPPATHALPFLSWLGWSLDKDANTGLVAPRVESHVGPGCVDGLLVYPGIPSDVASRCLHSDPPEPYIITNEDDCSSYFLCEEGTTYFICCPAGQLYDPAMLTCEDAAHVDCGSRPILEYPTTTAAATA